MRYPDTRTRPIPFTDPLRSRGVLPAQALPMALDAPVGLRVRSAARKAMPMGMSDVPAGRLCRTAKARYDGEYALNVRSCTTGQTYRFAYPGAVVTIEAADISLMKRIEQVTVLG